MIEQTVEIPTSGGPVPTFIAHPERDAPHPVVILFMDAPGVREELFDAARRIATVGYYVMLPDLYHRARVSALPDLAALRSEDGREQVYELMSTLSTPTVMEDADALLDYADRDAAASPGQAGCVGYCMSGQYAVNFAARHPERVGAAACIYGVKLVTDREDSPHLLLGRTKAELYFACAEDDSWSPLASIESLDAAAKARGRGVEVEIYPGVEHGFAFPDRPVYDKAASERHWERLLALFRRRLRSP